MVTTMMTANVLTPGYSITKGKIGYGDSYSMNSIGCC